MASIILYFDSQYLQIYFSSNQQLNRNYFHFYFSKKAGLIINPTFRWNKKRMKYYKTLKIMLG